MTSHLGLSEDAIPAFHQLPQGPNTFILYKIDPSESIISLEAQSAGTYSDFLTALPDNECRYAVYNFGHDNDKTVFVNWVPEGASVMERTLYVDSQVVLQREMMGLQWDARFEASDRGAIAEDIVRKRLAC